MVDWSGNLISWSEFFLFHVLPIAVAQIIDWIRDWQILIAAGLGLAFFHLWSRAILRAARKAARETVQSEIRGLEAGLKLLRRQIEVKREIVAAGSVEVPPKPAPPPDDERSAGITNPVAAVEQLRQYIRLALGKIPVSDDPLSPEGIRLYRAAIASIPESLVPPDDRRGEFDRILAELAALERSFPPGSCREAWQALVKVNAIAREFHEAGHPLARLQKATS